MITYTTRPLSPPRMNLTNVSLDTVDVGTIGFDWESATYFFRIHRPAGSAVGGKGYESFLDAQEVLIRETRPIGTRINWSCL